MIVITSTIMTSRFCLKLSLNWGSSRPLTSQVHYHKFKVGLIINKTTQHSLDSNLCKVYDQMAGFVTKSASQSKFISCIVPQMDGESVDGALERLDMDDVPYTVLIDHELIERAVIKLRNRHSKLTEQVHCSRVIDQLDLYLKHTKVTQPETSDLTSP